ncbi:MAG: hypothetical protein GY851_07550 [bacterium]|nr:hypothetical protein [bacterium]
MSEGMLRGGDILWLDTSTTPKLGGLHDYLRRLGLTGEARTQISEDGRSCAFYGATRDNPHNDNLDARLREMYSPEFAAQELDARWVSLSGRIWANWSDAPWPDGNVYHGHEWDGGAFTLAVDLGVKSAWQIWQRIPATDPTTGRTVRGTPLDCLVAEWQPDHGDAQTMCKAVDAIYGRPSKIVVGMDVHTRGVSDGAKPAAMFAQQWGGGIPMSIPSGMLSDKELQHWTTQSQIVNAFNQRSFVLSSACTYHTPDSGRTLPDLIRLDSWPESRGSAGSFFTKDKATGGTGLEDERDAMLYYMITQHPPHTRKERPVR